MDQQQSLPGLGQTSPNRISKTECLALITSPIAKGFGYRHLWIGYTGSGKTYANIELLKASEGAHKRLAIVDQKTSAVDQTPYLEVGENEIATIDELDTIEPDERGHIKAIIRGPGLTGNLEDMISFDILARKLWTMGLDGHGVLFSPDELSDACEGERSWLRGIGDKRSYMRHLYTQGRTNKISIAANAQHVQEIPRAAISNSDSLGIFTQDRKELPYYSNSNFLDAREIEIVASLKEFEFLFVKRGMESVVCQF
jgi:hypothetical protein